MVEETLAAGPAATTVAVPTDDGQTLAGTCYRPAAAVSRVVVIAAGTGIPRRYYDAFARYLCERGFASLTFDYRGIGDSRPADLRGFPARLRDWGRHDIAAAIGWAGATFAGVRLHYVAHSVGGQLLGLAPNSGRVESAVFVASQSGYWGHWPMPGRFLFAALWYAMPVVARAVGFFPARRLGLGEDLPRDVAREWAAWCRRPRYLFSPEEGLDLSGYAAYRAPTLAYSIDDDAYAPAAAVDALARRYVSAPVERRHLKPAALGVRRIEHFGFFRKPFRDTLWKEVADWLERA